MPPKSDPQRDSVYALEDEFGAWDYTRTPRATLEGIVAGVGRYYGFRSELLPSLKFVNKLRGGHAAEYGQDVIRLAPDGRNPMVLLHEMAHWLTDELYVIDVEDHGPEFVAILMHLYDKWQVIPNKAFRLMSKTHKIRIGRRYRPHAFR